jgi:hypothetical protein
LTESGDFNSYWKIKKPFISEINRARRINWALEHRQCTLQQWHRVMFTDESPLDLNARVWRQCNERYLPVATNSTVKHDKKVNLWGAFAAHGVGRLYKVHGILEQNQYNQMLIHHMQPSADRQFRDIHDEPWILQQDNDPKHTVRINLDWVANNGIIYSIGHRNPPT